MGLSCASRTQSRSTGGAKKTGPALVPVDKSLEHWLEVGELLSLHSEQKTEGYAETPYRE